MALKLHYIRLWMSKSIILMHNTFTSHQYEQNTKRQLVCVWIKKHIDFYMRGLLSSLKKWGLTVALLDFLIFLAFDFCRDCVVIGFFIPATTACDPRLRRISIPDFIQYIFSHLNS